MIIKPRIRGFICTTAHPKGCAAHVDEQIAAVKARGTVRQRSEAGAGDRCIGRLRTRIANRQRVRCRCSDARRFVRESAGRRSHRDGGLVQQPRVRGARACGRAVCENARRRRVLRSDEGAGDRAHQERPRPDRSARVQPRIAGAPASAHRRAVSLGHQTDRRDVSRENAERRPRRGAGSRSRTGNARRNRRHRRGDGRRRLGILDRRAAGGRCAGARIQDDVVYVHRHRPDVADLLARDAGQGEGRSRPCGARHHASGWRR